MEEGRSCKDPVAVEMRKDDADNDNGRDKGISDVNEWERVGGLEDDGEDKDDDEESQECERCFKPQETIFLCEFCERKEGKKATTEIK